MCLVLIGNPLPLSQERAQRMMTRKPLRVGRDASKMLGFAT